MGSWLAGWFVVAGEMISGDGSSAFQIAWRASTSQIDQSGRQPLTDVRQLQRHGNIRHTTTTSESSPPCRYAGAKTSPSRAVIEWDDIKD
jgi:hypothetical protein